MNPKRKRKLIFVLCFVFLVGLGAALVLYALKQNINLFYTPTQLKQVQVSPEQTIRLGGYVKKGSVVYDRSGEKVKFVVTDRSSEMRVHYQGVLPNLFREGQTVVVTGHITQENTLNASEVLAKHDEKYMPKGLAEELQKEGGRHGA